MKLPDSVFSNLTTETGELLAWNPRSVHNEISAASTPGNMRTTERALEASRVIPSILAMEDIVDENGRPLKQKVAGALSTEAKKKRRVSLILQAHETGNGSKVLFVNDMRGGRNWVYYDPDADQNTLCQALEALADNRNVMLWPHGSITASMRKIQKSIGEPKMQLANGKSITFALAAYQDPSPSFDWHTSAATASSGDTLSNLDRLEADSMHILREVVAQAKNPAMLFSLGKDSCVMLHLAKKAFYPSLPPFPLVHVDTRWKFQAMYQFRDEIAKTSGMDMIIHVNPEAISKNINPFDHGSELHTHVTKTEGLIQVLEKYKFDVALGGARRDEEKSRAKERVFSIRTASHRWDPKKQRPELWDLYNGYKEKNESIRAFPLSDWTELDIWQYIYREQIPIIPLYYADYRPVIERDGILMMIDDDRIQLFDKEQVKVKKVRFRTLGCYPLTGAIESDADDLPSIVLELLQSRSSERQGRIIDQDSNATMEKKKQEGYF